MYGTTAMTFKHILLLIASVVGITGCADSNAWFDNRPCFFPDASGVSAPAWVCHSQDASNLVTAVGFAPRSAAGANFGKQMAAADARVKLAQRLQGRCGARYVSDAMLAYSKVLQTQRSPREGYYVLVGIRPSDIRLSCR